MDSLIGDCWNCNKKSAELQCSKCEIAKYCDNRCLNQDIFRHQAECNFMGSYGQCSHCKKITKTNWCRNCRKYRYCSEQCKEEHWSTHQPVCKFVDNNYQMMLKAYYRCPKPIDVPWYWGNTVAVDYLKLFQNEGTDCEQNQFKLLFAACGDLRNIVKTVADLPSTYTGKVEFYLNDYSAHIMARNVLFLYLCCTVKDAATSSQLIVQLWYSLLISDNYHYQLMNALERLSYFSLDQIKLACCNLIHISEKHLNKMRLVWKAWFVEGKKQLGCMDLEQQWLIRATATHVKMFYDFHLAGISPCHHKSLKEWISTGLLLKTSEKKSSSSWKPNVTLLIINPHSELADNFPELNPLMMESNWEASSSKNMLILFWDGMAVPFQGWDYLDVIKSQEFSDDIVGMFQDYIEDLIKMFISVIQKHTVSFFVFVEDIICLKEQLPQEVKFDRIATSNMTDYYPESILLKTLAPFMNSKDNPHSILITEYQAWLVKLPYRLFKIPSKDLMEQITAYSEWYSNLPNAAIKILQEEQDNSILLYLGDLMQRQSIVNNRKNFLEHLHSLINLKEYIDPFFDFMLTLRIDRFVNDICEQKFGNSDENNQISFEAKGSLNMITSALVSSHNQTYVCSGLKMREFWNQLNKVVPFRYKINARRINFLGGHERSVEWVAVENNL